MFLGVSLTLHAHSLRLPGLWNSLLGVPSDLSAFVNVRKVERVVVASESRGKMVSTRAQKARASKLAVSERASESLCTCRSALRLLARLNVRYAFCIAPRGPGGGSSSLPLPAPDLPPRGPLALRRPPRSVLAPSSAREAPPSGRRLLGGAETSFLFAETAEKGRKRGKKAGREERKEKLQKKRC